MFLFFRQIFFDFFLGKKLEHLVGVWEVEGGDEQVQVVAPLVPVKERPGDHLRQEVLPGARPAVEGHDQRFVRPAATF
jgi:hypothetical protein